MDKQAFKQRMQNLKSYQENNPGKGYYVSMKYGYIDPNPDLYYTTEQFAILDKWEQNSYFTNDEKDFIINYLIDCLVENQPFDCSSLGPNKYLNE